MSMNENMSEEQILDQLFEAAERLPEENVRIQRLDLLLTLRGLTSSKVDQIRERCTIRKTTKGRTEEKVDTETFNALLISEATVKLKVRSLELSGWGDTRITGRMKLSGGEQAVRRMLLAGELDAVGDKVLELSGFGVEIEDLKN
ncbi:phage tail assembly chaperone [Paenibacillus sp. QZ-Y1]|uniref:phage tail assembly chaperone n=1 Tax=Paenibacillus sp. QZ-Y1 TaxID=3414511 RepID=UPI003F793675